MAELLKEIYNEAFFEQLTGKLKTEYPHFPERAFLELVYADDWEALALKQRMRRITESLRSALPADYREALSILKRTAVDSRGLPYMLYPDFVERYGLEDPEASIEALALFTRYSSSEFAVRPFIVRYPSLMLEQLKVWAANPDEHVRRLASEGSRPRLPWAMALGEFKRDPRPILELLELLKEDESEYVRRSVANNLNDIAKDHPDLVLDTARKWYGQHPHTDWIVRHGCRGLLKRCDPEALRFFGFVPAEAIEVRGLTVAPEAVRIGASALMGFTLVNHGEESARLRIEYGIDFVKANGRSSRKLFKLSEKTYAPGACAVSFSHSFMQLTTRKHYPGEHGLAVIVNGSEKALVPFCLHEEL
ncbi:DNA alkylation repair protein [Paenibacillus ginsengarvi]|uniref:DNA alkylation repair protein n=1 Tax=Paenibacillus ginsengarvi TaxID=400777 RepID=A0A3B0CI37_9BACL|nr:DNA alkylation repair protein [Paenibacillus ginsengarvi]RKN84531.1 DNA alkylation repair protein [Paenibacillus ginsengarvi]